VNSVCAFTIGGAGGGGIYSAGHALTTLFTTEHVILRRTLVATLPIEPLAPASLVDAKVTAVVPSMAMVTARDASVPCNPAFVFSGQCATFVPTANVSLSLLAVNGTLQCEADVLVGDDVVANELWVLTAVKGTWQFDHTPDPLSLESCVLMRCLPEVAVAGRPVADRLVCNETFSPLRTVFRKVSVRATQLSAATLVLPISAVSDAQPLDPSALQVGLYDGWAEVTAPVLSEALFSIGLYGVVSNR
jgi:hypothetical protein